MCHVRERIAGNDPRVWFVSSNVKVLCGNDDNKCQLNDKRERDNILYSFHGSFTA